jgi:hypothetical protein
MIDLTTPEGKEKESRRVALMIAKRHLQRALDELNFLTSATPTSDVRNRICDANIYAMHCKDALEGIKL